MKAIQPNVDSGKTGRKPRAQVPGRPSRRDFYSQVVLSSNGSIVPDADWKKVGTSQDPKELRKQLKGAGMQQVRVFRADDYAKAREDFRAKAKTDAKAERDSAIADAFSEAGVDVHPRIASSLRTLLPLYRGAPSKRTVTAFRNIIRGILGTSPMFKGEEEPVAVH